MDTMNDSLGLLVMPGTEDFGSKVDFYLKKWRNTEESFLIPASFPRFSSGDAKVVLEESVRGKDIFILSDPYNYSVTYNMRGVVNHMSPDDHFQNIKRAISAIDGKARRTSVLMNFLYGSRQHYRSMRESLDCAMALRELENLSVSNFITFDAHDPKVQNAVPVVSFDNFYPNYQMIKALVRTIPDISFSPDRTVMVAPDASGVQRCIKFAESLNLDIGMFYKQRDTKHVEGGHNKIVKHQFIGSNIAGKDVIIVDDILSSGDSMLDSFRELKKQGAKRILGFITFGMFTNGYEMFDKAYADGVFDKIFITNLTYHQVDGEEKPYLVNVDLSKYAAYIIESISKEISISKILEPGHKIHDLLEKLHKVQ